MPTTGGTVEALQGTDRYTVISSDCHAGASISAYRPYLDASYRDDFDAWMTTFENPYKDLTGNDAERNWDSDRRLAEMEADGVVAEVIFPNTIPPFFPAVSLLNQLPSAGAGDLERRWAGLQAHNRWLAGSVSRRSTHRTTNRSGRRVQSSRCRSTTTRAARRPTTATTPRPS